MEILDDSNLPQKGKERNVFLIVLYSVAMAGYLVAFLIMGQIKTIVATGPILAALGLIILTFSIIQKRILGIIQGFMTSAMPVLVFMVIVLFHIGPERARHVLPFFMLVFLGIYIPFSIICLVREANLAKRQHRN